MGDVDCELVRIQEMSDRQVSEFLKKNAISLKGEEARRVVQLLGRDPTLTELHIFNTQWSEHSSYKSSRDFLKLLPTKGPEVILGPAEDAGIVKFTEHEGEAYGIVMSHESHNHPSQVMPYEGAATGVGGNVRDVLCMGARVIASADPLRFGNPDGKNKNRVKYVANQVIEGIAGYGNALGVPVIAGDIAFNDSFDDNCLVNVVTLGILKEKDIIHSTVPKGGIGYDIIIIGKATDNSGFGGAAFASLILDEADRESNRGAVQVPDPFLKNVIIRATEKVFAEVRKQKIPVGFKDMGAGGIMCSTSELVSSAGYGADIDLDRVHVSMHNLPPFIIACSETQERFTWICPPSFTDTILRIYNLDFDLPTISKGARASVVGKVTASKSYTLKHKGKIVCNADVEAITTGIKYQREQRQPTHTFKEPEMGEPKDYVKAILDVLSHPNVASKAACYKHYDSQVQGLTVIQPGDADAGVQAPLPGCCVGIALSVDSNPKVSRIDPYWGAANAVAESMRNVAAVGATPVCLTDCLNYGNPEKPEAFYAFVQGIKGLSDAASHLHFKGTTHPVPFISGNVSFYNESSAGKSVDPSAIVACLGRIEDISKVITMKLKQKGSALLLVGERKDCLGGSVWYDLHKETGAKIPQTNYLKEKGMIHAVIDAIDKRLILSCHDISDGGIAATLAEMILGGEADGEIGATVVMGSYLPLSRYLFSESSGFVLEVSEQDVSKLDAIFRGHGIEIFHLGTTGGNALVINGTLSVSIGNMKEAWTTGFRRAMA